MPAEVILPRVDMDMATGRIAKWLVGSGSSVTKGQPLFEIETDKAAMEIEAPSSGIIRDMAEASDAAIPVGSVVAWIYAPGEAEIATPAAPPSLAATVSPDPAPANPRPGAQQRGSAEAAARPRATPMARRLAREQGLDLGALQGSGPRGRVQAQDVAAATARARPVAPAPAVLEPPRVPLPSTGGPGGSGLQAPETQAIAAVPQGDASPLVCLREGSGTPLLLVHGFGGEAGAWRPFLSGRGGKRPVYALDLPGHGVSTLDAASLPDIADAVERAIAGSPVRALDLVGHSLGGAVAATLAARGTLDVRSLLLLAPAGLGPAIDGTILRGILNATSEASLAPWLRALVADPAAITSGFVRATLRARDGTALVTRQRAMLDALFPDDTQSFSIREDLARLCLPTRIMVGAADAVIPAQQAQGLPPLVALHRLAGVGHLPHMEARDIVWAIMDQMAS